MREKIYFQEEGHLYFGCDTELQYESVSHVAKKILEPYINWQEILINKARKLGISPEELQAEWDKKKQMGTDVGTILHNGEEHKLFQQKIVIEKGLGSSLSRCIDTEYEVIKYTSNWNKTKKYQIMNPTFGCCYPELILSLKKDNMRTGGQSDKIFIDKMGFCHVYDYKTDKTIEEYNRYGNFMKPPFNTIDNCNKNMYSMKMSAYMFMLLYNHKQFKPGVILLEHKKIKRDENLLPILDANGNPQELGIENHEIDYKKWEPFVKQMFNEYWKLTNK